MTTKTNKALKQTQEMPALARDQLRALSISVERRRVFPMLVSLIDDIMADALDEAVAS